MQRYQHSPGAMLLRRLLLWLVLLSALVGSAGGGVASAQRGNAPQATVSIGSSASMNTAPGQRQQPAATSGHVTIIVLDMSGSMAQNDPQNLRCSAANTYIDLSGPGDYVGVVGLDNPSGGTDANHPFGATVDWNLSPQEMATDDEKQHLRAAIAQQSNNCSPDGSTPTYDALLKAETMLESATNGKNVEGSVILLTDGDPEPDPNGQFNAITQNLLPKFQAHNWAIDSIALGPNDGNFHQSLQDLSLATSGTFHDDEHGPIPGVSPPFNITPFFVDIFQLRNQRSTTKGVDPTPLDGGTTERQISIPPYTTNLDIVVTKDDPATQVVLKAPDGEQFPPATAGISVFAEDYFVIFSIAPQGVPVQEGNWSIAATGTGTFSVKSLYLSEVTINILTPTSGQPIALGEAFAVSATVSSNGVSQSPQALLGVITYDDAISTKSYSYVFPLTDPTGSGVYTNAAVTVPLAEPAGTYQITVAIPLATTALAPKEEIVRLADYPTALLLSPGTKDYATAPITANVIGWNVVLRTLYSLPLISAISGLPLSGQPAIPSVIVQGQVVVRNSQTGNYEPYSGASVTATYHLKGSSKRSNIAVIDDGKGAFHLAVPAASAGTYEVTLTTKGSFQQTHGDLTHAQDTIVVALTSPTVSQQARAWAITALYLLILVVIYLVLRYPLVSKPFGTLERDGNIDQFRYVRRSLLSKLLRPNRLNGSRVGMRGIVLIFYEKRSFPLPRRRNIVVKCSGGYQRDGNRVTRPFPVYSKDVVASPGGTIYTISVDDRPADPWSYSSY